MFDNFSAWGLRKYINQARKILDGNWTGHYTKPSPSLYPHQWNWDSGFVAIGYAHYNETRAMQELRSLFENQWENGMVPQIVFNPEALGNYFPEPDFWQVPDGRLTSGITMPPLHAIACLHIYQHASNRDRAREFLQEMFPKLLESHRYFYRHRDPLKSGLVYIRHPWESGLDNSPNWDAPLRNIEVDIEKLPQYERRDLQHGVPVDQRPGKEDYDRYVYLVDLFRSARYDESEIYRQCPFLIQDVLFNSILCRANRDLIEIGNIVGRDVKEVEEWLEQTTGAISGMMWSDERMQFDPIDLVAGRQLPTATAASFMPLFALAATADQADALYGRLNSVSFCALHQGNCFSIPNFDMKHEDFDSRNYWRGPVWININWMLSHGLKSYGYHQKSDSMKKDIIQLPIRFGFHEYFDSITGQGYGSSGFSWTAALFLDLVHEYYESDEHRFNWIGWKKADRLGSLQVLNDAPASGSELAGELDIRLMSSIGGLKESFYDMNRGLVDYPAVKDSKEYQSYLKLAANLRTFDLEGLDQYEKKLAFWINLYNTIVVHGIIELGISSSVREISDFFTTIAYEISGFSFSPNDIEHGILRANTRPPYRLFKIFRKDDPRRRFQLEKLDPRIHFALVCGSRSCAPIRFYDAESIDDQLETATRNFINSSEIVVLPEQNKIMLSQIFRWYAGDFGHRRDLFEFILRYLDPHEEAMYLEKNIDTIKIEYLFYDWNLNH